MAVRKTTLLNGAPKRPHTNGPHPGMTHQAVVAGQNVTVRGASPTQVGNILRGDQVHLPSRGKALYQVGVNPGTRSRRNDSSAGIVMPAAMVNRAAPGAVRSRRC
jgi:hypothetical protein